MAMHYARTSANRELTLIELANMSENEAWNIFRACRFGNEDRFSCPKCTEVDKHCFIKTRKIWRCKHCDETFSVTSDTPLHKRKLSFVKLLCILFEFITGLQGVNANALPSKLDITYKTAYLNLGKIREVVFETMDLTPLKGIVYIDCLHICGKPRRSNKRKASDSVLVNNKLRVRKDGIVPDKKTHPEPSNIAKLKNRRIVLALCQQAINEDGDPYGSDRTISYVISNETAHIVLPLIKKSVAKGSVVMSDFGSAFNMIKPILGLTHLRVNHSVEYQTELGVNNNQAESMFSRLRRAEYGTYNGISNKYLAFYAAEFGYKNDSKYMSIKDRFYGLLKTILKREPSKAFYGYSQGGRLGFEYIN